MNVESFCSAFCLYLFVWGPHLMKFRGCSWLRTQKLLLVVRRGLYRYWWLIPRQAHYLLYYHSSPFLHVLALMFPTFMAIGHFHSQWFKVYLIAILICISLLITMLSIFPMPVGHLYIFFVAVCLSWTLNGLLHSLEVYRTRFADMSGKVNLLLQLVSHCPIH